MATRFYLPSTGAPSISPAFGAWDITTGADRISAVTTRISSSFTNKSSTTLSAGNINYLLRQYVSAALAAQSISGTIKGNMRCIADSFGGGALVVTIAKCNSAGSGRTTILTFTFAADYDATVPPAFESATLTNRRLEGPTADDFALDLTTTAVSAEDRLIIELGLISNVANDSFAFINFGDNSSTDLGENETETTANNPWVEFSNTISFFSGGPSPVPFKTVIGAKRI